MPIPIIPIVAVLGAGTLGYFVGRKTAPCPASVSCPGSCGDAGEDEQENGHEDEETRTASHAHESGGEMAGREEGVDAAWKNMTRAEALEVLGLAPGTKPDAIREAHRRIMQRIHPEQGGSRYLAAAVDRAMAVLLG